MKIFQRQVDYWAHMLDECKLDEASDESTSSPDTLTAGADDSTKEIVDDVMDDELEEVCQNLEFLLHSDDDKARALYTKFKEGFKDKFSDLKCKVGYVSIKNLHPTQNVIFLAKSIKPMLDGSWTDKDHDGQPVIKSLLDKHDSKEMKLGYLVVCNVGGTNYLIDGHHRWSKAYMMNPNSKLYAYVLPSDGVFKTEDDVLKFAQCEIALYLGRGNQKNHPVNAGANKAGDANIYEASSETIKQKVNEFLTDEVVKIFADKGNVLGGKTDTREKIADYVAGNKEVMVKNAPAGAHDRTYMPQYPDSNGPGEALQKVNEGISRKMKNTKYTKKQITEAIAYWEKQLKAGNYKKLDEDAQSEYDENGRDEYGFTKEESDIFLFDIVDQTGSIRNGNYDHYAVRTDGTILEHEVKKRLDEMARVWSGNALRNAKREAKKRHEQLKPYDMPYLTFKVANVKHMTKQQFIEDNSLGEIRFLNIDD